MPKKTRKNAAPVVEKRRGKPQKYGSGKCFPLSFSVPADVVSRLDGYADARNVSRSAAAVVLIADALDRVQSPQPPNE